MKSIFEKNVLRKYLLMVACLILFFAGGFRAFNLYKTYKSYNQEIAAIEKNTDENIHTILRAILIETHDMTERNTKNDSLTKRLDIKIPKYKMYELFFVFLIHHQFLQLDQLIIH